ncbi:hypothetical protein GVAV_001927 [Gurleya vavrai]
MTDNQPTSKKAPQITTSNDLASAANAVAEFEGNEDDDIFTWKQSVRTTSKIFNLDDSAQLKLICCRLRGKASKVLSSSLTESPWLTADEVINKLKKQFSNTNANHKKLNQFLATKTVTTRKEYEEMLDLATETYQRRSIAEESLIRLTITKCPAMLRPMLIRFTYNDGDWYEFLKEAKQNAWVAFADEKIMFKEQFAQPDQIYELKSYKEYSKNHSTRQKHQHKQKEKQNCVIHGWCYHSTQNCQLIEIIKKKESKRVKEKKQFINQVDNINVEESSSETVISNENFNKNNFYWCNLVSSKNIPQNNFILILKFSNNFFLKALVDTGADVSLISIDMLAKINKTPRIKPTCNYKLQSACGTNIPVLGKTSCQATHNKKIIESKPLVTKIKLEKIILGRDFITHNPKILYDCIYSNNNTDTDNKSTKKLNLIENTEIQTFLQRFKDVFADKIDAYTVCTGEKHQIVTDNSKPIKQFNFRMPVHFEKAIDEEIKNLEKNKIIQECNSN